MNPSPPEELKALKKLQKMNPSPEELKALKKLKNDIENPNPNPSLVYNPHTRNYESKQE